jgi:hypothetical protein
MEVILDILLLVIGYLIIIDIKHNVSSIIYEQRVKAKLKLLEEKNKELYGKQTRRYKNFIL